MFCACTVKHEKNFTNDFCVNISNAFSSLLTVYGNGDFYAEGFRFRCMCVWFNLPARKISTVGCTWPTCDRAPLLDTGGMMSNERVIHLSSLPSNNLISVTLQQFRTLWFCLVVTTKLWWRPSFCRVQWFTLRKWWSLQLCRVVYLVLPDFLTPLVSSLSSHFRWLLYKDVFFCSLIMCLIWTFPFKWNVSKLWKGVCLSFHGKQKMCYSF